MRRLAEVNDLKKYEVFFTNYRGRCGGIPRRRGKRKTGASRAVAWGKAFPLFIL
jgi:hypothetical protein